MVRPKLWCQILIGGRVSGLGRVSPESAASPLKDWDGKKVPPGVYHALSTPYRGQTGLGKKMMELLDFFEDVAVLVPTHPCLFCRTYQQGPRICSLESTSEFVE